MVTDNIPTRGNIYDAIGDESDVERLDAANALRKAAAIRVNVGIVISGTTDSVDCQVQNSDGSTAIRRFCRVLDSPHALGAGDTVLVFQAATGASFAKGLVETHILGGSPTQVIAQNTFLARVLQQPIADARYAALAPVVRPDATFNALIPRHISTDGMEAGAVVSVARDTGPPTRFTIETGATFYNPVHWITGVFYPPIDYQNAPVTPHVGLRFDTALGPVNIEVKRRPRVGGALTGLEEDVVTSPTPFSRANRQYNIGTANGDRRWVVTMPSAGSLAVRMVNQTSGAELPPVATRRIMAGTRAQGAFADTLPNQRVFLIDDDANNDSAVVFIMTFTDPQTGLANAYYFNWPQG